jgi:hypothetical protein
MLRIESPVSLRGHVERAEVQLRRFHVCDGSSRIVIEAHDQDDALCLCIEMGWELICACDD